MKTTIIFEFPDAHLTKASLDYNELVLLANVNDLIVPDTGEQIPFAITERTFKYERNELTVTLHCNRKMAR